jgi:hypothetical protein
MNTIERDDIEFSPTPTGFEINASMATYWSIPPLLFMIVATTFLIKWFDSAKLSGEGSQMYLFGHIFMVIVLGVFWWNSLLRACGTQVVSLDFPTFTVSVEIGPVKWGRQLDTRTIQSISEGGGTITTGEYGPAYKAVVLKLTKPLPRRIFDANKFVFGHYLTKEQRKFIINRLHERIASAA